MSIKNMIRCALAATAPLLWPMVAFAHPALGSASGFASGFVHPFTGLDHILTMVAVGVFAANLGGRALWAVPLTFMALMAFGGVLGIAHVSLPYVELVIALSLVALGLAVAIPREWPLASAMLLVGVFAVFHGHAHGTEMAETISAAAYGLGFILATGVLHLAGIAIGLGVGRLGAVQARRVSQLGGIAVAVAGVGLLLSMG